METNQYLSLFVDESREHLQALNDHILKLERNPKIPEIISEIFRSVHTLKGMAASMGFEDIASLTHSMENIFDQIRHGKLTVTTEVIDIVFVAIEYLEEMINSIAEGHDGKKDVSTLIQRLERIELVSKSKEGRTSLGIRDDWKIELDQHQLDIVKQAIELNFSVFKITVKLRNNCILKGARAYMVFEGLENSGEVIKTVPTVKELEEGAFDQDFTFIFLSQDNQDNIRSLISSVSEVEEVVIEDFTVNSTGDEKLQPQEENQETSAKLFKKTGTKTIRVNLERIDELLNLFEELVIERGRMQSISENLRNRELDENVERINRISSQMQSLLLSMRMVPIEQVFNRFPRMIRELSRNLNKKINIEIYGADTELDRTVIDEISEPILHLIRNSLDHGIELPQVRKNLGKPEDGKLVLRAFHSGNHVFIEVEDDGAGISREKIESKIIEKGLLTASQVRKLTDSDIFQYILMSGFSTANQVSDVSGRGVGLDVVKNKIEALGGNLRITSKERLGSKFSIQLPLTLSIIATLLVKVEKQIYAIPLSSIIQTNMLSHEDVMYISGQRAMDLRGKVIPVISLAESLQLTDETADKKDHAIVIVKKGEQLAGLMVDSFIGQKEIVIKSMGQYLGDVFGFSGATILGDGQIALILDPNAFI